MAEKGGYRIGQALAYVEDIRRAWPDKLGVYVLHSCTKGYKIVWYDPSGAIMFPYSAWNETSDLLAYVISLYSPPAGHYTCGDIVWR
jgi:hypothetical protein